MPLTSLSDHLNGRTIKETRVTRYVHGKRGYNMVAWTLDMPKCELSIIF
jgi:hypothetical protein